MVLRSRGHIYETRVLEDDPEWTDSLHNTPVIPADRSKAKWASALIAAMLKMLDRVELLNEGRKIETKNGVTVAAAIWTKAFRLNLYNAQSGAKVPTPTDR